MKNLTMQNFVHFCFNYPHNFVDEAFKGHRFLSHLRAKFTGCYNRVGCKAVIPTFFSELDSENQTLLNNYVASLYEEKKEEKELYQVYDEMDCKVLLLTNDLTEAKGTAYNHQCVLIDNHTKIVLKDYSC